MTASTPPITLTTNVASLRGVGPQRAAALRRMGIRCVADLLLHLPHRYERELGERSVDEASEAVTPVHGAGATLTVRGEILTLRQVQGRRTRTEATLFDGTGTLLLTWFNAPWLRGKLHPGMTIRAWGKAKRRGDYLQLVNPRWEPIRIEEEVKPRTDRLRPIYPASEEMSSSVLEDLVQQVLEPALANLPDHLHPEYRDQAALPELAAAYRMVHAPANEDEVAFGRRRLAFDELLMLQLGVMLKRAHRRRAYRAPSLKRTPQIDQRIRRRFPFPLTESQNAVIEEIVADVGREGPMNRLLQGDVGSGKTVVALYAMLLAVAAGHQAALMAPTEVLAEQHDATIRAMLAGSRVRMELLTGALPAAARRSIQQRLREGELDLVIGTHSLLAEKVKFKSLALAVVDEQHRFGVEQRAVLRVKSTEPDLVAHTLVMTATPIPRTLSLTVFGDLDVSTIRGLPPGRAPIATRVVSPERCDEVYAYLARRIAQGEQAYIVVPVIDETESGLTAVDTHLKRLAEGHFRGRRLAAMHGRLKKDERDEVMRRFREGDIDVLVATTVIEVGVDVPNASIMVIEQADRFGLAQLHQLRGRVGRGSKHSICVLIGDPVTDEGKQRLEAIAASNDGFAIAEKDLEIRGPGELFGTRQSGLPPFRVAQLPRDLPLLQMARRDASAWIEADPELASPRDALLRKRLLKAYGQALGLGDVA